MNDTPNYDAIMRKIETNKSKAQKFVDELDELLEKHKITIEVEGWLDLIFNDDKATAVNDRDFMLPDRFKVYKPSSI